MKILVLNVRFRNILFANEKRDYYYYPNIICAGYIQYLSENIFLMSS
jgi:hypothetical protein